VSFLATFSTHAVAFLAGTAAGAAGAYFADRFTDQRRRKEAATDVHRQFKQVETLMPELIAEMRADLTETPTARDFFVLESERVMMNVDGHSLAYYETSHKNLKGKISILENHNYILDITTGNAKKYRMTEPFAALLTG
jgi:hypothetical protein